MKQVMNFQTLVVAGLLRLLCFASNFDKNLFCLLATGKYVHTEERISTHIIIYYFTCEFHCIICDKNINYFKYELF